MNFGWHPREHRKALDGMLMLTLEERGAYNTCLDLIYDRQGPIPDDPRWLAGWMGVTPRRWAKIRAALVFKTKLFEIVINGVPSLMNRRAAIEIENQSEISRKAREFGKMGGRKSSNDGAKSNDNNGPSEGGVVATLNLLTKTYTVEEEGSVAKATGDESPAKDPNAEAWELAVGLLVGQGAMTPGGARTYFGRLLRDHGLEARDLLSALAEAFNLQTPDVRAWLTKSAQKRAKRQTGPPKRVGFV